MRIVTGDLDQRLPGRSIFNGSPGHGKGWPQLLGSISPDERTTLICVNFYYRLGPLGFPQDVEGEFTENDNKT